MIKERISLFVFILFIFSVSVSGQSILGDSSLVSYINFDSPELNDISGNGNNGIMNGGTWISGGKIGGALEIDGVDDYVSVADFSANFPGKLDEVTEDFSVALWVKPNNLGVTQSIFSKGSYLQEGFGLTISGAGFFIPSVYGPNGKASSLFGDIIIRPGIWNHLVFVYDFVGNGNSIMKLYVNGVLDSITTNVAGPIYVNGEDFRIGFGGDAKSFGGFIDEFMIFNKILSTEEISAIYNNKLSDKITRNFEDFCPDGYSYEIGAGCKSLENCNSYYVCSPKSICKDGFRDVLCEDLQCGKGYKVEKVKCDLDLCVPDYECSDWSLCENGISIRSCNDINNCRNELSKPSEKFICNPAVLDIYSSPEFCTPNIECGNWDVCEYVDDVGDIFQGVVKLYGLKERSCVDLNGCVVNYLESSPCKSFVEVELSDEDILLSPGGDVCVRDNLALSLNDKDVALIDVMSWVESDRLDASFIQGESNYCDYCFDGVKSGDEEGVDCGGSCKACVLNFEKSLRYLIFPLLVIVGLFFIVLFLRNGALLKFFVIWNFRK